MTLQKNQKNKRERSEKRSNCARDRYTGWATGREKQENQRGLVCDFGQVVTRPDKGERPDKSTTVQGGEG
ncbi:hypothetical protein CCM_02690 [Cordyceps militaris CM01]|uniref:Uncharacterized protein n=1 Tax=Cordyceps militaris (strain CM01) TaxID=983644 RepID=G3JB59_CORMM|nr:uncharacterized protein CCM_02690 [Cordyceps militaris CM01]EGX94419.1 hypothetical protein CCM_02690 [Cordyceps militaris CM01]